jgi:hybrid cluster-associated redox disulfide protein
MITKEMTIAAILQQYPQTLPILKKYGLDCSDCQLADYEELEHGAGVHHADMDALLHELNSSLVQTDN